GGPPPPPGTARAGDPGHTSSSQLTGTASDDLGRRVGRAPAGRSGHRLLQRGLLLVLGRAMVDLAIARGPVGDRPDAAAGDREASARPAPQPSAARAPLPAWSRQAGAVLASDRQRPFERVGNNDSSPSNQRSSLVQVPEGIREFLLEYPLLFPLGKKQTAARRGEWQMRRPSISSNPARPHLKYIASGVVSRKLRIPMMARRTEVSRSPLER